MRRGYARAVLVAATALFGQAMFAWVVSSYVSYAYEHPDVMGGTGLSVMLVPVLAVGCLVVAVCLVLPVLAVARGVRRESWRAVMVIAVGIAAVPVWAVGNSMRSALLPTLAWWLGSGVALGVAALAARAARRRTRGTPGSKRWGEERAWRALARTAGAGTLAVLLAVGVGYGTYATGLVTQYEPPLLSASSVEGTWRDGDGGSLRLMPGGHAVARDLTPAERQDGTGYAGLAMHSADGTGGTDDADDTGGAGAAAGSAYCSGEGSWAYEAGGGGDPWQQKVRVSIGACGGTAEWSVLGSEGRPKLYRYLGDPDAQNLYVLRRS
ncbi:hypothetical protein [Streptomyces iconiensis]|uniref:Integral membrane protein n=1 Tax=Streptomyces iconiensis TaxID=1384038 RepID=A0ABT7AAE3_9ACTN|nr:hypothetical protein [Streptomyces iconiensis]MDJ1137786.1 hypothetical protein [Streptomyces iconiensis]